MIGKKRLSKTIRMLQEKYKPFFLQIIRFNRMMYLLAAVGISAGAAVLGYCDLPNWLFLIGVALLIGTIWFVFASIFFSWFIYDRSSLYTFNWLLSEEKMKTIWNIFSGYTEAGHLLEQKAIHQRVIHFDFYSEEVSVTSSIQIAKKNSQPIQHTAIQFDNWNQNEKTNCILFMQSLHELREESQQIACLREAKKYLAETSDVIYVVEHLRDINNFLIYASGVFHFFSRKRWLRVFEKSGLTVEKEFQITPFIRTFILKPTV
jgi:hypothetical protein